MTAGKVLTFTGHRPDVLGPEPWLWDPWRWVSVIDYLEALIVAEARATNGELWVVEGQAEVFDLCAGGAGLRARKVCDNVKVCAVQPFKGDTQSFHTETARAWHNKLLREADWVPDPISEIPWKYAPRNEWMCAVPQELKLPGECWPCWNGRPGRGTSQTVRMAREAGLVIRHDLGLFEVVRRLVRGES